MQGGIFFHNAPRIWSICVRRVADENRLRALANMQTAAFNGRRFMRRRNVSGHLFGGWWLAGVPWPRFLSGLQPGASARWACFWFRRLCSLCERERLWERERVCWFCAVSRKRPFLDFMRCDYWSAAAAQWEREREWGTCLWICTAAASLCNFEGWTPPIQLRAAFSLSDPWCALKC